MRFKKIIRLFEEGNVCVTGLKGRGKDMLMANVVARRHIPYVCNVDYKAKKSFYKRFNPLDYDTKNTYRNFIENDIVSYVYPHEDGTDIYISDAGVYFPSQYCSQLDKLYGGFVSFMALSRHLGNCNVHVNVQNLNRCWTKVSEQSDGYIMCNKCIVLPFGFVLQLVTIYEKYESCVNRVPPFSMKRPLMNKDRQQQWEIQYTNYRISHGKVERRILFYRNITQYDTRVFKTMLNPENTQIEEVRESLRVQLKAELLEEINKQGSDAIEK